MGQLIVQKRRSGLRNADLHAPLGPDTTDVLEDIRDGSAIRTATEGTPDARGP